MFHKDHLVGQERWQGIVAMGEKEAEGLFEGMSQDERWRGWGCFIGDSQLNGRESKETLRPSG